MAELVWDEVGKRIYETGLDRGVLYLPDGSAVPWNGLTSVVEAINTDSSPVYYDGMKINDLIVVGDFVATMTAITYPDEFVEIEGIASSGRRGISLGHQTPKMFGLCYRTKIGNDVEGDGLGYKLHIVYNLTVIPNEKKHATQSASPTLEEFQWAISAIPEEVSGFRPTAHFLIDSRDIDPWLLEDIEAKLYGDSGADASLIPMSDLVTFISDWYRVHIVDNGDGTWTATSLRDESIEVDPDGLFTIHDANAVFLDPVTYQISDTNDIADVPD